MKTFNSFLLIVAVLLIAACNNSPFEKAKSSVQAFMKSKLKNPEGYEPISFSELDTIKSAGTSDAISATIYKIYHSYSIVNSSKDKVKITVTLYLNKELKVDSINTASINGEYGSLSGNVFWKYNDIVGNKPDGGAEITLFSLDSLRGNLTYQSSADVQGNYKIEKVQPGKYFLLLRSKNTTDCPDSHLKNLLKNNESIKMLFGFDILKYKTELDEIHKLDSLENYILSNMVTLMLYKDEANFNKCKQLKKEKQDKAEKLIESFPNDFKQKIQLFSAYSNSFDFSTIEIEDNKNRTKITDFGITCL